MARTYRNRPYFVKTPKHGRKFKDIDVWKNEQRAYRVNRVDGQLIGPDWDYIKGIKRETSQTKRRAGKRQTSLFIKEYYEGADSSE